MNADNFGVSTGSSGVRFHEKALCLCYCQWQIWIFSNCCLSDVKEQWWWWFQNICIFHTEICPERLSSLSDLLIMQYFHRSTKANHAVWVLHVFLWHQQDIFVTRLKYIWAECALRRLVFTPSSQYSNKTWVVIALPKIPSCELFQETFGVSFNASECDWASQPYCWTVCKMRSIYSVWGRFEAFLFNKFC